MIISISLSIRKFLTKIFSTSLLEPIILVSFYVAFLYIVQGALPTSEQLVAHLSSLYGRYGYEILFLGALLESLVVVNLLAPGMIALAFGGIFARSGQLDLTFAILASVAGALLGFIIDYFLGLFGFSKIIEKVGGVGIVHKVKDQINKSGVKILSLGYFHPNLGSVISFAAGTIKMNFISFITLSTLSTLAWFSLWGVVVFALGDIALTILSKYLSVLGILITSVWFLLFLYSRSRRKDVHR